MPTTDGVYTPKGTFNDETLSPEDKAKVEEYQQNWFAATTDADREYWHQQAEGVRAGYGYSGGTDGSEHIWADPYAESGAYTAGSAYTPPTLAGPTNYSQYVRDMNEAATAANIEALTRARDAGLSNLDAEQAKIAPMYYDARNQAQATSAQSQRNFDEYAAARGIGTGAQAGMMMANSAATQGGINSLNRDETAANVEIERQRTMLHNDYESRIAEAVMSGQYQLAQGLYNEMIRQDNALMETSYRQAGLDFQGAQFNRSVYESDRGYARGVYESDRDYDFNKSQADTDNAYRQAYFDWQQSTDSRNFDYGASRDAYNDAANRALTFGYVSEADAAILGIPAGTLTADQKNELWYQQFQESEAARNQSNIDWEHSWAQQQAARSGGGGSGGGGSGGGGGGSYEDLYAAALASGNPLAYINANAKYYGVTGDAVYYLEDGFYDWYSREVTGYVPPSATYTGRQTPPAPAYPGPPPGVNLPPSNAGPIGPDRHP